MHSFRTDRRVLQRALPVLVALIPVLTSFTLYREFTGDDTYIHLVFARNLATGQGFAFNPGEPTYGASSPLWVILLSVASLATGEFYWTARVLSLIFSVSAVISVFLLARRISGHYWIALGTALVFAVDPHFDKFAFSGMETSLAITLVMIGFYLHMGDLESQSDRAGFSTIVLGVATLVRPECVFLFASCLVGRLLRAPRSYWGRLIVRMSLLYFVVVGPWWLYAWFTFGKLVPNTAIAKSAQLISWRSMWNSILDIAMLVGASYLVEVVVLLGIWTTSSLRQRRLQTNMPLASMLWVVLYLGVQVFKGVDIVARYLLLVSPLLTIAAFEAVGQLVKPQAVAKRWALFPVCLVLSVTNSVLLALLLIRPAAHEFSRGFQEAYTDIGQWLEVHTQPDETVAVGDVGAVGYFSHRYVFDLGGLVTPEAIDYMWGEEGRFVESVKPDYLVIRKLGSAPAIEDWTMRCVEATPVLSRTFSAVGSRTLGIQQFTTLFRLHWLSGCSTEW